MMSDFFNGLFASSGMKALESTWSFTHARHRVIADNIANLGTPGFKSKDLDYDGFQQALGSALAHRESGTDAVEFRGGGQVRTEKGQLSFKPTTREPDNVLFHDGTNASLEQEMSDLAQNAMIHELTTNLLGGRFESLRKAIRGRA
jgi:flagellar basal-body rod protein FlgB